MTVCLGTACHLNGSRRLLQELMDYLRENDLVWHVRVEVGSCMEHCDAGPTVTIDGATLQHATLEIVTAVLRSRIADRTGISSTV